MPSFRLSNVYTWLYLVSIIVTCDHLDDCTVVKRVKGVFDPNLPFVEKFQTPRVWPNTLFEPITFVAKSLDQAAENWERDTVIIQIAMNEHFQDNQISPDLVNCFIDRSVDNVCKEGRRNPRCCYEPNAYQNMQAIYPVCEYGCQQWDIHVNETKWPCRAVCWSKVVLQVELQRNRNNTGGRTALSATYKETVLVQSTNQSDYGFSLMSTQDHVVSYKTAHSVGYGSSLNGDRFMGFWMRWVPPVSAKSGPYLEVGRDGQEDPYFVADLQSVCFDCNRQDQFGWRGADVSSLPNTFSPKFWDATGLKGQSELDVGMECKNVIFSRYSDQVLLGGPCIRDQQCRSWCDNDDDKCEGRICSIDTSLSKSPLEWTKLKTCQYRVLTSPPNYIVLMLVFVGLLLIFGTCLGGLCLFYIGSTCPFKRRAKDLTIQAPTVVIEDVKEVQEWQTITEGRKKPTISDTSEDEDTDSTQESHGLNVDFAGIPVMAPFTTEEEEEEEEEEEDEEDEEEEMEANEADLPKSFVTMNMLKRCECRDECQSRKCPCYKFEKACGPYCHGGNSKCINNSAC